MKTRAIILSLHGRYIFTAALSGCFVDIMNKLLISTWVVLHIGNIASYYVLSFCKPAIKCTLTVLQRILKDPTPRQVPACIPLIYFTPSHGKSKGNQKVPRWYLGEETDMPNSLKQCLRLLESCPAENSGKAAFSTDGTKHIKNSWRQKFVHDVKETSSDNINVKMNLFYDKNGK